MRPVRSARRRGGLAALALLPCLAGAPNGRAHAEFSDAVGGASQADRSGTPGPIVAIGYGPLFSGTGLLLAYALPVTSDLRFEPRLSFGLPDVADVLVGSSAGLTLALGRRHRALLDAGWGPVLTQRLSLHGTILEARALYGLQLSAGYGLRTAGGLSLHLLAGLARAMRSRSEPAERDLRATVTLGVGWKAW